ncbi:hypothetical protein AX16_002922 [Volvariella volvacea WC 439]|nr:hypothetical protein AX16_002922 [Volvariella volvacea WC 439]
MYIGSRSGSVKLKICRPVHRIRFYTYIKSNSGDVTVWVPSDFKGTILYDGRAKLSAGFINRIIHRVDFNDEESLFEPEQDVIIVETTGKVTFRMWDCVYLRPENPRKESFKRFFSCLRRQPVAPALLDWDWLLDD